MCKIHAKPIYDILSCMFIEIAWHRVSYWCFTRRKIFQDFGNFRPGCPMYRVSSMFCRRHCSCCTLSMSSTLLRTLPNLEKRWRFQPDCQGKRWGCQLDCQGERWRCQWSSWLMYRKMPKLSPCIESSDGLVVSFQKTAVAVLASLAVFLKTTVAVVMRLC